MGGKREVRLLASRKEKGKFLKKETFIFFISNLKREALLKKKPNLKKRKNILLF